jgi:hypothetical protein
MGCALMGQPPFLQNMILNRNARMGIALQWGSIGRIHAYCQEFVGCFRANVSIRHQTVYDWLQSKPTFFVTVPVDSNLVRACIADQSKVKGQD